MSRHRRQPSRALPLDFNVVDDEERPAGANNNKGATSLDGSQQNPGAGCRGDAGKGQEGHTSKKPPPPPATAAGSRSSSEGAGNKSRLDDGTTGRR